jgi:hypothetical protein
MAWLRHFRLAVFVLTLLFSLIVMGICGHIISETNGTVFFYFTGLGIASAVLSIVFLVPMYVPTLIACIVLITQRIG